MWCSLLRLYYIIFQYTLETRLETDIQDSGKGIQHIKVIVFIVIAVFIYSVLERKSTIITPNCSQRRPKQEEHFSGIKIMGKVL